MTKSPRTHLSRLALVPTLLVLSIGCGRTPSSSSSPSTATTPGDGSTDAPAGENVHSAGLQKFIDESGIDKTAEGWRSKLPRPPQLEFAADEEIYWNVETSEGPIVIKLMPQVAPMHVSSLMYLTQLGFYDGLIFHRIIPGFMAQGGCPQGSGFGNPGYRFMGETSPDVKHDRPGLLSAANTGQPQSDGSQFFLTFVPTPHLDGKHTIYGEVVEGLEVLPKMEAKGSGGGRTSSPVTLERATIQIGK